LLTLVLLLMRNRELREIPARLTRLLHAEQEGREHTQRRRISLRARAAQPRDARSKHRRKQ
jgi:hypothetical protein